MSRTNIARLVVGVRLLEHVFKSEVIKYHEDTGQPYQKVMSRNGFVIAETQTEVDPSKIDGTGPQPQIFFPNYESKSAYFLGVSVADASDFTGNKKRWVEIEHPDVEIAIAKDKVTQFLQEQFNYTGPISVYLINYVD